MDHWGYPGRALPGNRSIHHEPIHGQEPLDDIRDLLFDHAIYRRYLRAHHGRIHRPLRLCDDVHFLSLGGYGSGGGYSDIHLGCEGLDGIMGHQQQIAGIPVARQGEE
jgi:hypothetical protein